MLQNWIVYFVMSAKNGSFTSLWPPMLSRLGLLRALSPCRDCADSHDL